MAMLNFKMGNFANLENAAKRAGTVYITKDEKAMYVDISNTERIRINQICTFATFADFTAALETKTPPYSTEAFYYIEADNALLKYNATSGSNYDPDGEGGNAAAKGKWIQINSTADVQSAVAALTGRVATLEEWKTAINAWRTTTDTEISDLKKKDTAIDGEIKKLQDADIALGGRIDTEITDRQTAVKKVADDLAAEVSRATTKEGQLNTAINTNQQAIADEATRAQAAEKTLQDNIDVVSGDLAKEVTRSTNADTQHTKDIATNTKAISDEVSRAKAKENELNQAIADETSRAQGAEQVNATAIANEKTRAEGIEAGLRTDLGAEVTRAKSEEARIEGLTETNKTNIASNLAKINQNATDIGTNRTNIASNLTKINKEIQDRKDAVAEEKTRAEGEEARIEGLVTAEASRADTEEKRLAELIAGNTSNITKLQTDLGTEETQRKSEITRVEGLVSAEADRATKAENKLSGDITQLQTTLSKDIGDLEKRVETNETNIGTNTSNITALQAELAAEKKAREDADKVHTADITQLGKDLTAERNKRIEEDTKLENTITANKTAADTKFSALDAKDTELATEIAGNKTAIEKEVSDRKQAITDLNNDVISRLQAADAMKYKGTVSSLSDLESKETNAEIGFTYKATGEFTLGQIKVAIGDLLIANGTETNGVLSSVTWDHVPSGYVADYNPSLTTAATSTNLKDGQATLVLVRGDDSQSLVTIQRVSGNESFKVNSTADGSVTLSLEWGEF